MTDGRPCEAPSPFVDPQSGYCWSHSPDALIDQLRQAARVRGGLTTRSRQRRGIHPDELPPLTSIEAAEVWAATIARAVALGQLTPSAAQASLRGVAEFRASYEQGRLAERLKALEAKVAQVLRPRGD